MVVVLLFVRGEKGDCGFGSGEGKLARRKKGEDGRKVGIEFGFKDRYVGTAGVDGDVVSVGDDGNALGWWGEVAKVGVEEGWRDDRALGDTEVEDLGG